jgi:DNA-binding NarL/FixJ family response regulator
MPLGESNMRESARPVRVLTVDDQGIFRAAARELVARTSGFETVGEAHCGASALAAVADLHPDLVLLDVRMAPMDGVETARRIHADHPDVVVVLMSVDDLEDFPGDVAGCGAVACLRKRDLSPRVLARAWAAASSPAGGGAVTSIG